MKKWAILILVGFVFTLCLGGYKIFVSLNHPLKYENIIKQNCNYYNLPPSLVASVINVESGYDQNATSNKNAIGLMQIKLSTANYLNEFYKTGITLTESELFAPQTNIKYGCMYLNYLFKKFKDTNTVLASYNAGETVVRSWLNNTNYSTDKITLQNIPFLETKNYIKKINNNLKFYKLYF